MSYALQSATASNGTYCAYRTLWAEVIKQAFLSAMKGDRSSMLWFTATNGRFVELCGLLNLDAQQIRNQLLNRKDVTK
ncbi:hypothetical protein [Edaphobacter sp. 12200R-103]|uniref:hypothetical protein n=1 Tax=Edaphobacter sp. 12200R-103 TaxID=2703788 RepID=UPI00138B924A|nr:hypothetical protein [Edaphobacter sp. 12200R-103]QHS51718.1 hypothetical protein GWR55_08175 [Edaphobacter sp. 12200R-103]